jgi:2'-5' RNA ligase
MRPAFEDEEEKDHDGLRCFVAVLVDPAVLDELQVVQRFLRRQVEAVVRWTQPEQMHLTLHFLGEVEAGVIDEMMVQLGAVTSGFQPLELFLQGTGVFPERGRPRVIWAGLGGEVEKLGQLQREVVRAVAPFGDHQEVKSFHPHLTMGRMRPGPGATADLPALLRSLEGPRPVRWRVRELALIRSDLLPSGAKYTVISTAALAQTNGLP